MDPMLDAFERVASGIQFRKPTLPLVPNLTGAIADGPRVATAGYWREHIRRTVQFELSMRALDADRIDVFVEIGPASTLLAMGSGCLEGNTARWTPTLRKGEDDWAQMLQTTARLYTSGAAIGNTPLVLRRSCVDAPAAGETVRIRVVGKAHILG